jgi:hypothetical protein
MKGAWFYFEGEGISLQAQGALNFSHQVAGTPGAFDLIRKKVFDAASVQFITQEPDAWTQ